MNPKFYRQALDRALRGRVPDYTNMLPHISAQFTKGQSSMKTRQKITLGVVLALILFALALFSLPDVARALRQLFGYIPGLGVVETGTSLRMLAQPVVAERDGVTVTI